MTIDRSVFGVIRPDHHQVGCETVSVAGRYPLDAVLSAEGVTAAA